MEGFLAIVFIFGLLYFLMAITTEDWLWIRFYWYGFDYWGRRRKR